MQSHNRDGAGVHVAIIMDGNGRWASRRGLPRAVGHQTGIEAIRRTLEAAPSLGIDTLTLFAFSSDNWRRPPAEVGILMALLRAYLAREAERLAEAGVRLSVIGRRDRLPGRLGDEIAATEAMTREGTNLHLRVAIDYSARDAILHAASILKPDATSTDFARGLTIGGDAPDVDLLIRTGGEKRLSDFLLWEVAYAEILFTDLMWPDFDALALHDAMDEFGRRHRRFGGLGGDSLADRRPIVATRTMADASNVN